MTDKPNNHCAVEIYNHIHFNLWVCTHKKYFFNVFYTWTAQKVKYNSNFEQITATFISQFCFYSQNESCKLISGQIIYRLH